MKRILLILFVLLFATNSFAIMSPQEIIKFKKLPEGTRILMVLFSVEFDNSNVVYGKIEKDILDNNYLKCYDCDRDCWRIIYPFEKEAIEYFIEGENT